MPEGRGSQPEGSSVPLGDAATPLTLDQRIAIALQLEGRASWRDIAHLVGTSESTVARRARALLDAGTVRITSLADPLRCGFGYPVLVLFSVTADSAVPLAARLAGRDDVRFAVTVTGPFGVVAEVIVGSREELARTLLGDLASIPGLVRTTTETVLRTFKMSYDWSRPLLEPAGVPPPQVFDVRAQQAPVQLDAADRRLIALLGEDGRYSFQELAGALGVSESAARRRVDRLISSGCVTPVTLVAPQFLGYEIEVLVFLRVELGRLEDVAAALVDRPEVRYLSATSGYSDLVAEVILRTQEDLYRFRTDILGSLPGIRDVDTALELETFARAHLRMSDLKAGQQVASQKTLA